MWQRGSVVIYRTAAQNSSSSDSATGWNNTVCEIRIADCRTDQISAKHFSPAIQNIQALLIDCNFSRHSRAACCHVYVSGRGRLQCSIRAGRDITTTQWKTSLRNKESYWTGKALALGLDRGKGQLQLHPLSCGQILFDWDGNTRSLAGEKGVSNQTPF